jgi:hypothetical protein
VSGEAKQPLAERDPTHGERVKRYRKRHPEKWAEQARRYSRRTGSEPRDFGGHRRGRKLWSPDEEDRVVAHTVPDRQLAEELDRTVRSISVRRSLIKRRAGIPATPKGQDHD